MRKIIRDFVTSWFASVSSESAFEREVHTAMISIAAEMKIRAGQVDRKVFGSGVCEKPEQKRWPLKSPNTHICRRLGSRDGFRCPPVVLWWQELTHRVLGLIGCHLRDFLQAQELLGEQQAPPAELKSSLWTAYSSLATPHLAVSSRAVEVNYTRALVDLLLHVLVPLPHLESPTGRFVVGELITCNVLLPFIAKLSDPDWLNGLIIQVCGSPAKPEDPLAGDPGTVTPPAPAELAPLPTSKVPPVRTETETTWPESAGYEVIRSEEAFCPQNTAEEESGVRRYTSGSKATLFYLDNDSEPEAPFVDCKQIPSHSLVVTGQEEALYARQKEGSAQGDDSLDLDQGCPSPGAGPGRSQPAEGLGTGDGLASLKPPDREGSSPLGTPSRELLLSVEPSSLGSLSELSEGSPLQSSSPLPSFSFEPLSSPDGPVLIQNLRITGTITAKEHRGTGCHPYTLYTIKVSLRSARLCCSAASASRACVLLVSSTRRRWAVRTQAASRRAPTTWRRCCRPASILRAWPITRSTGGTASSSTCRRAWRRRQSCGGC